MFYSILLVILGLTQSYSLYRVDIDPALIKDITIKIRVSQANSFQMSCDDFAQYQFEEDGSVMTLTQEQRTEAGCSDSKFVFGIPPSERSLIYIEFKDSDWNAIEEFEFKNQDLLPNLQELNNNTPMLYNDFSKSQKMHYQIQLNQICEVYVEVNTCYDKFDTFELTTINNGKQEKYNEEKEYRLVIDPAINPIIQIELEIQESTYNYDPKFIIKYQYFPVGTLIPYDQFLFPTSFTQSIVNNQLVIQVPKIRPKSVDQKYSFIQIIALFTTDQNINLVSCLMGDSQLYHYYYWDPQFAYQQDHLEFTTLKFKQNSNKLNYVYLYAVVFVEDIQITQSIGGQTFYLDEVNENLDFPLWLLVLILTSLFILGIVVYLIWKKQKNQQQNNTQIAHISDYLQP